MPEVSTKPCRKCGGTERGKPRKSDPLGRCLACASAQQSGWYATVKDSDSQKAINRARKYGISPEEQTSLFESQGGRCGSCGDQIEQFAFTTHLDHDHKTGRVRDFLCHHCNRAVGYVRDSAARARQIAVYLSKHEAS